MKEKGEGGRSSRYKRERAEEENMKMGENLKVAALVSGYAKYPIACQ